VGTMLPFRLAVYICFLFTFKVYGRRAAYKTGRMMEPAGPFQKSVNVLLVHELSFAFVSRGKKNRNPVHNFTFLVKSTGKWPLSFVLLREKQE
jgi:hypothetical protein